MIIPEATIQEILNRADIVAIIGEHIQLKKEGNNYKGVCPFHDDTNPSLTVSPSKKIFSCFSCGTKGNAITFIQKYKHLSFVQAVAYVGEKCGVEVKLNNYSSQQKYEKLYKIMQEATSYYEFFLKNTNEGQLALEYLHNRKLNDQIIKRFRIGLASKENNLLFETLSKKEEPYLPIDLIRCGLITEKGYYDTFKKRIIFPIDDIHGNIVGFSGRIYLEDQKNEPKYINTSENEIFKKKNILYNYSYALNDIKKKDQIYIFEGFMDVIAAFRAGIYNTVATMGTALTHDHIVAIKKLTKNIVLCFDGDNAGINATKRAIKLFLDEGINVNVMLLPEGMDPDEYIDKYGEESLNDFLSKKAINSMDYLYSLEKRSLILSDLNSIERFKRNIFSYIKMYNSKVLENQIIKRISEDLQLENNDIVKDFHDSDDSFSKVDEIIEKVTSTKVVKTKDRYIKAEEILVFLALKSKEYCSRIFTLIPFEKNIYVDVENRNLLNNAHTYYKHNHVIDKEEFKTKALLDEALCERMDRILNYKENDENYNMDALESCAETLLMYRSEKMLDDLRKKSTGISEEDLKLACELKKKTVTIKQKK